MIGTITKLDRLGAVISAPYIATPIRLLKRDFQSDVLPFDHSLIGVPISFTLVGGRAVNAWACSCDFMAVAEINLSATQETGVLECT